MQYETCRHVKEDGTYCGSPALRDRKYCYYHLMQRGRRLRRARALRDNLPYRFEIHSLDNLYAVRAALTDIAQALAAGQLDPRTAGTLLYAIQRVTATNRRIEQMETAQLKEGKDAPVPQSLSRARRGIRARLLGDNLGSQAACPERSRRDDSRIQEWPEFEQQFAIPPGIDLDAATDAALRQADEEAALRQEEALPLPPPGVRPGSVADRLYREEAFQILRLRVKDMQCQLRACNLQKHQQFETMKKEVVSATPSSDRHANSA